MVLSILRKRQNGQEADALAIPAAKRYVVYAVWQEAGTSDNVLVEYNRYETRDEASEKSRKLNASRMLSGRRSLRLYLRGYIVAHLVEGDFDEPDADPEPPQQRSLPGQVRRGPQRSQAIRLVRKDYEDPEEHNPSSVDQLAC
ncbi:MAG TPA: hypothetical protein VF914_21655 [Chloroflexia bacterium]|jgi:hypothetical protein